MSFADIKGQDSAISFLKSTLKNGKLSHAYIFCGPGGVGKALAAMNFAKALICQNAVSHEGCGNCPSCKKIENLTHPDVFVLKPDKEGGAIKIDDVRKLIKDIYLKPFEAKKKVYIIHEAQDMKHEAANALLKTLEEPPTDSILILLTDSLKALFNTIVSRSQVVRFYPLKYDQIKEILVREHGLDENRAHVLSRLSCGRLGEAIKYKDEEIFQRRPLENLSFDNMPKEKVLLCLDILLSWFRDILTVKAGSPDSMLVNIDKKEIISREAKRLSFDYLEDAINNIMSTMGYLDQNVNQKLAMSVLGIKLAEQKCTK